MERNRCAWVNLKNQRSIEYHDHEWGVPIHDDQKLFEFIVLESAQAGLSWEIILKKREGYRGVFKNFDPVKVARMTQDDVERLFKDASIIRNRLKIEATINNARQFIKIQKEFSSFSAYMWKVVDGKPIQNKWKDINSLPKTTKLAVDMAKDLKKRGFIFLGPVVWYAYMEAVGMVNDHTVDCFRFSEVNIHNHR